uniref:Uncharacterized protein n=1 Tax=viral metagenome TaxID=1070528 RepID=A0A6C0E3R9_9ZZZZ
MLLYSICYYHGKNKKSNLKKHVACFLDVEQKEKQFLVCVMVDSFDIERQKQVETELSEFIETISVDINYKILSSFNWGGTIAGLWVTYNYSKTIGIDSSSIFIGHFEEDFGPYNKEWVNDSMKLLTQDVTYVGETTSGTIKSRDDDQRFSGLMHRYSKRLGDPEVWTDGGYYFSTLEKLMLVEERVGVFHKGDQQTKYIHLLDGIDYGEVGFPTLLYHNNFKFTCLHREKYFIHEW